MSIESHQPYTPVEGREEYDTHKSAGWFPKTDVFMFWSQHAQRAITEKKSGFHNVLQDGDSKTVTVGKNEYVLYSPEFQLRFAEHLKELYPNKRASLEAGIAEFKKRYGVE